MERENRTMKEQKQMGVQFAMNGTIKEINLNERGTEIKNRVVSDKASLIAIFEEIFGQTKQAANIIGNRSTDITPGFDIKAFSYQQNMSGRMGLKSAGNHRQKRSIKPPLAKSMQNFGVQQSIGGQYDG